jgi:hypothetical protein
MTGQNPTTTDGSAEDSFESDLAESRRDERTVAAMVPVAVGLTGALVALFLTQVI